MAAAVLIDGRGAVLKNRVVTIRNGKIERIAPRQPGASVTYDLGNRTLLPGFIDTHVHMDSHFGVDGRAENRGETQLQRLYAAVDNAYATVAAGYTTAQSIGSAIDADLRKGSLHNYLGIHRTPGLAEAIAGTVDVQSVLHHSDLENIDFIPQFACDITTHGGDEWGFSLLILFLGKFGVFR